MPNVERLLRTLRQAQQAFLSTPGRRGRVVNVNDVEEILVTGDLHGNLENFRRVLLKAELRNHPGRHLVFQELIHSAYYYADGADKSHQLIDLLAALKCQFPARVHCLLGNHELGQWTNQWIAKGESDLNELFRKGVDFAYGSQAPDIYAAYLSLFAAIPLAIRTPNRVFLSHSLPSAKRQESFDPDLLYQELSNEAELKPGGIVYSLVWGRDTKAATVNAFLKMVDADLLITGHIPCGQGFAVPNDQQIILDSMAVKAGYCLFPAHGHLSHQDLVARIAFLS